MSIKSTALILLVGFGLFSNAETLKEKAKAPETKTSMAEFLDQFMALKKYLISDEEFQDSKNSEDISMHLNDLVKAVKKTAHDPQLNQENFKFSRQTLEDHVTETERVFRLGNKAYARWMTNSTLGICMSCHTQMPTSGRNFSVFMKSDYITSEFDRAEFMFATKNFEGASQMYQKLISDYPKSNLSPDRLEKSVRRELAYQIRIKRDFNAANSLVESFKKNNDLPLFLKTNLKEWGEQLTQWKNKKLPVASEVSSEQLAKFAEQSLSVDLNKVRIGDADSNLIADLVVSSLLYEYLQKHPSFESPDILYWLAVVDRELDRSVFYSLADLYLKECILKFPGTSMAGKCYKEYEKEMVLGYTGSAGTNVPIEVIQDLKFLKSFVESKGKVPLKIRKP